jgi:putative ABC transport system permease protein
VLRVALKGLAGRKLRSALTALAIVLGVAMVSGTFVLTDTIQQGFDRIFGVTYKNTSAVITSKQLFGSQQNRLQGFSASLLPRVRRLPGVAAAVGSVADEAQLIGRNGKPLQTGGAPNLAFSVDPSPKSQRFNPLSLVDGTWPRGPGEIAIDASTAGKKHYRVGDTIGAVTRLPERQFRITAIVKLGGTSSIGGATLAIFDVPTAQTLFDKRGRFDAIRIAASAETSEAALVQRVRAILPPGTQVRSSSEQAKSDAKDVNTFIGFLQKALLAFAGIALFVGAFVIANTLSITVAQRAREFATLRTLGANRRQVLASVMFEALAVGVLSSVVGLFAGLGLAKALNALFVAIGIDLPRSGTVFATRTVIVSLLIGVVITLAASFRPALRATRVPPIAAVREGAVLPPSRFARYGPVTSLALIAVAVALLVYGTFGHDLPTVRRLIALGVGVLLLFFGVALFAPRVVRPLAAALNPVARWAGVALNVLVWPTWSLPFWLLRHGLWGPGGGTRRAGSLALGAVLNPLLLAIVLLMGLRRALTRWRPEWPADFPGVLAEPATVAVASRNARRNPQRTASTAAALMIGLALVTFVALFAQGLRQPFEDAVNKLFVGDYAVTATNNFSPFTAVAPDTLKRVPGVEAVSGVRAGEGRAFGNTIQVTGVDRQVTKVIRIDWLAGSPETPAQLGAGGAFVDKKYSEKHGLSVGSPLDLETPSGKTLDLVVKGIFDPPKGGSPFGRVTISTQAFDVSYPQPNDIYAFVKIRGGVTDANTAALKAALEAKFPNTKVATAGQFKKNQEQGLNQLLNLLFVLLGLSIVISVFGIVNTLVLTVFERTRELGMLRAVGMTRRQVRRMIRHESVVTALIGAALGIALGFFLAALVTRALSSQGVVFAVPWKQVGIFVVASVVVGVVAAVLPARRAARIDVLRAIAYE